MRDRKLNKVCIFGAGVCVFVRDICIARVAKSKNSENKQHAHKILTNFEMMNFPQVASEVILIFCCLNLKKNKT
jgi:hypothetical protein